MTLCSFNVKRIFLDFTMNFVISTTTIFSSLVSLPAYGCPTNDFVILWLWIPQINFTIHPSPLKTSFARNLNGHPHFLLSVHLLTKSFFLGLYSPLLSQAINKNETLPLTILVSDFIITTTNPMSQVTDRAQCKIFITAKKQL